MKRAVKHLGRGLLFGVISMGIGLGWVTWSEAKNCTSLANCNCGDTLVASTQFGAAYTINCPNKDQALTLADGVWLDCSGTTVVGNGVSGSAAFRLGYGSTLVSCKSKGFQYGVSVESWYATIYAVTVISSTDEGVHFKPGTQHNTVNWCAINAPREAIYLYGSHYNEIMNSVLTGGSNAVYAKDGSSHNWIHNNSLNGGSNRLNQVGAGPENLYYDNDAHGGILRSSGSTKYSGIHNNHQGSVNNLDGALWPY